MDGNGDKGQYGEIVEQCKGGCQHEPGNYPDEHIYMKVPSRLALVGNLVKYPVRSVESLTIDCLNVPLGIN